MQSIKPASKGCYLSSCVSSENIRLQTGLKYPNEEKLEKKSAHLVGYLTAQTLSIEIQVT